MMTKNELHQPREWIKQTNDLYNKILKSIVSINQMPC